MFETVLVVDRGASAHRVVRTCQRLGARTVVAHASDDRKAPAVRVADEAVPLGGSGWSESYGDPVRVVEAAQRSGAEAVHPGAGWLASDAALARSVLAEGLVWLGLPPEVLERTADQSAELVHAAGLDAASPSGQLLVATTLQTSGGPRLLGLREQRRADDGGPLADLAPAVLADDVGSACEHAALAFARSAGAGPLAAVGLVVDPEGRVGVAAVLPPLLPGSSATEAVAGLDLVELQLRLASGEEPDPGRPAGCAVALHLRVADRYAGRLRRWSLPEDDGVQVDAAVRQGDRVHVGSDRTLAVLTVAAEEPAALRERARAALAGVDVDGVPTSLPALHALLDSL